ncbi:unnamed protein product [Anisakis simplex]|uniref:Uncharacterized protein n=1 Tax=Anisakis simplex TaxID=6269 RepID=A0A3P6PZV5_ANISI|nr:unnamed protein product [Anisakis simplex]
MASEDMDAGVGEIRGLTHEEGGGAPPRAGSRWARPYSAYHHH